jgi:hypothetical protein
MALEFQSADFADNIVLDGTMENLIWVSLGYNDFASQMAPAVIAGCYAMFLDRIHILHPTATVIIQTPIPASTETGTTYTLGDYRTAFAALSTTRVWTQVIDGTTLLTTASLVDGVHPSTAGHVLYANKVRDILGTTVSAALAVAPHSFWLRPEFGRTVTSGKLAAWTDYTGHAFDVSATGANQPADSLMGNNTPAALFTGTELMTHVDHNGTSTDHTWCFLLDEIDVSGAFAAVGTVSQTGNIYPALASQGAYLGALIQDVAWIYITGAVKQTGQQVLCFTYSSAGTLTAYRNGVSLGQLTGQQAAQCHVALLGGTGGGNNMIGKLAAFAYCDTVSAALVTAFTAWGKAKVGI